MHHINTTFSYEKRDMILNTLTATWFKKRINVDDKYNNYADTY